MVLLILSLWAFAVCGADEERNAPETAIRVGKEVLPVQESGEKTAKCTQLRVFYGKQHNACYVDVHMFGSLCNKPVNSFDDFLNILRNGELPDFYAFMQKSLNDFFRQSVGQPHGLTQQEYANLTPQGFYRWWYTTDRPKSVGKIQPGDVLIMSRDGSKHMLKGTLCRGESVKQPNA